MKYFVIRCLLVLLAIVVISFTGIKPEREEIGMQKDILSYIIQLEGTNEVPPVTTEARGMAVIRVTGDKQLQSRVMMHRLEGNKDGALIAAYLHSGAAGTNGPVIVMLAAQPSDFEKNMAQALTTAQYESLLNDPIYINVVSTLRPSGLVRGQVR
jgi:hypothetical protein